MSKGPIDGTTPPNNGAAENQPDLPGGPIAEWMLYKDRVDQTGEQIGFRDPDDVFYPFIEGEEIVFNSNDGTNGRDVFIRVEGGDEKGIPLEDWKQLMVRAGTPQEEPGQPQGRWRYNPAVTDAVFDPSNARLNPHGLPLERLRELIVSIRTQAAEGTTDWPSGLAEQLTIYFRDADRQEEIARNN